VRAGISSKIEISKMVVMPARMGCPERATLRLKFQQSNQKNQIESTTNNKQQLTRASWHHKQNQNFKNGCDAGSHRTSRTSNTSTQIQQSNQKNQIESTTNNKQQLTRASWHHKQNQNFKNACDAGSHRTSRTSNTSTQIQQSNQTESTTNNKQ